MSSVDNVNMSTSELRERVLELGRRQVAQIEEGVADIWESNDDPDTRRAGITWGLAAIPDVREASLNTDGPGRKVARRLQQVQLGCRQPHHRRDLRWGASAGPASS